MNLEMKVRYLTEIDGGYEKLQKIEQGDWIDVRSAETIHMEKGDFELIPLGFAMQLPAGYEAHLATRSSTFKKWGILMANSHGVIDESYCGDNDQWFFPALAMRKTTIEKGDRIAQFRLVEKMPPVQITEVSELGNADRGGIGSTGRK